MKEALNGRKLSRKSRRDALSTSHFNFNLLETSAMSSVQKKMLKKSKSAPQPTKQKPLPDESSDEGSDAEELAQLDADSQDEDDSSSDESEDVTEEALERMMNLLGDVDAEELGLLQSGDELEEGAEGESEDEQEGSDDDADEEDDDEEVMMQSDDEAEAEELYEDLEAEEDGDVVPVERTTVNDKVSYPCRPR